MPNYDIATRAQALTLKIYSLSNDKIERLTGINRRTVSQWLDNAISRGLDPKARPLVILDCHVKDGTRSGRPTQQTPANTEAVLAKVRTDRYGREKSCWAVADELGLSEKTVWRILHSTGFSKTKPTCKPGLSKRMKT